MPPVCNDATCCDAEVKCGDGAGYTCSSGFQDKATKASIVCTGMPPVCDDATCCDAEVKCGAYMCSAGFQDKARKATIVCTGMPPACSDATCCDVEVKCGDGGGHTCSAGFQDKAGKATIVCTGVPPVCDDATCCDAELKCETFPCSGGKQDKAGKATIVCAGMPPVCDALTCCDVEVKCGGGAGHTCSAGFQDKVGKAAIICPGMPPACDDATCCDAEVKCGTFTCSGGFQNKASKAAIACVGMPPVCDDATCCDAEVKCNSFTCPSGFEDKTGKAGIVCAGAPPKCTTAVCCDVEDVVILCATHTCSSGLQDKPGNGSIACVGQPPACTDALCCDVTCASHTCGVGFVQKADVVTCPEQGCSNALCCHATCAHADFTCKDSATVKQGADGITCGATAGSCTQTLCCDAAVKGARDTPTSGMSVKSKKSLKSTTDVAAAAALGTANGGKLAVLKNFGCVVDDVDLGDDPLDWEFHPTQAAFGSTRGKYFFAALVLNPLLVIGFGLIACAVAYVMKLFMGSSTSRAFGDARAPGVVYLLHIFLLQGTSLVAAQVCFAPGKHSVGVVVLSWFVLIGCVASPAVVYFGVLRRVPVHSELVGDPAIYGDGLGEETKPGKRANARWYKFLFGTAIWVSKEGYFAEQYGVVFENLRADCLWYVTAESGVILSLSLLSAIKPSSLTTCDLRNFTIAAILVAFFLACLLKRPYIAPVDNCIAIMLSFLMAAAVVAMSLAIALEVSKSSGLYTIAKWCLLLSAMLMIAKVVWDIAQYIADVVVSRRSTARELARLRASNDEYENVFQLVTDDAEAVPSLAHAEVPCLSDGVDISPLRTSRSDWSSRMDVVTTKQVLNPIEADASTPRLYRVLSDIPLARDEETLDESRSSKKGIQRSRSHALVWV